MIRHQVIEGGELHSFKLKHFICRVFEIDSQLIKVKKELAKLEKAKKETVDDVLILEHTLINVKSENNKLKQELNSSKLKYIPVYECDECEHTFEADTDMKEHKKTTHAVNCSYCKSTFAGNKKFENHICKVLVENPISQKFYMKEWFEKNKCIRVFDNDLKKEVVILHSEDCISLRSCCTDLPKNFSTQKPIKDTQGITHLTTSAYMDKWNRMDWVGLLIKLLPDKIILPFR